MLLDDSFRENFLQGTGVISERSDGRNKSDVGEWKRIAKSLKKHPTVEMFQMIAPTFSGMSTDGRGFVAKCTAILDASAEQALSWCWRFCSDDRLETHKMKNGDVLRTEHRVPDFPHSQVVSSIVAFPQPLAGRLFETWMVWGNCDYNGSEAIAIAFVPREKWSQSSLCPIHLIPPATVVAATYGMFLFERLAPEITRISFVQRVELRGSIPNFIVSLSAVQSLSVVERLQERLQRPAAIADRVRTEARQVI